MVINLLAVKGNKLLMYQRGQPTSFQQRLEIKQRAESGQNDPFIAKALGCSVWTVRKWRRIAQKQTRSDLSPKLGRPAKGPLSSIPSQLQQKIKDLRLAHPGWGPNTLLAELRRDPYWSTTPLPSRSRVAAFLKEGGLTRSYQPHSPLPHIPAQPPDQPHAEWQLDAQGVTQVAGVGRVSIINVVDVTSRIKIESYPSLGSSNPALADYQLTLRRAFQKFGLPQRITFDHGTVFYDNTSPSPYPTKLHLWLLALGVQVGFTRVRRPTDHAMVERTHQTISAQALKGQKWSSGEALWRGLDERREVINKALPIKALGQLAPLQAYPQAGHSGRDYRPEWEKEILDLERIYEYLGQGKWFRQIHNQGNVMLGGNIYYVNYKHAGEAVEISFDPVEKEFVCQPARSETGLRVKPKGLTKAELMGELGLFEQLPVYQLSLPFDDWGLRQQEYAKNQAA
jgi:transposase InsO family protein